MTDTALLCLGISFSWLLSIGALVRLSVDRPALTGPVCRERGRSCPILPSWRVVNSLPTGKLWAVFNLARLNYSRYVCSALQACTYAVADPGMETGPDPFLRSGPDAVLVVVTVSIQQSTP